MSVITVVIGIFERSQRPGKETNWSEYEKKNQDYSVPQYCENQWQYSAESWRPKETCYHSHFSEKPTVKTGGKKLQKVLSV